MRQTNERLKTIEEKLEDLTTFKAQMLTSSKWTSAIISTVITLAGILVKYLN